MTAKPITSAPPALTSVAAPILVFYDGDCRFCNHWVGRLIAHDPQRRLRYGSKGGSTFARVAQTHPEVAHVDSIVVVQRRSDGTEAFLSRSRAIRAAVTGLPGFKSLALLLAIVPPPLSDLGYALFARWRGQFARFYRSCAINQSRPAELFVD